MKIKPRKYVRFEESNSETSFSPEQHSNSWQFPKWNPNLSSVMSGVRRGFEIGSSRMKSLRKSLHSHSSHNDKPKSSSKKIILDPQGPFVQRWNKIFVLACVIAVSLDPLFFYIPVIDGEQQCLDLDDRLKIAACVLRSFTDLFYIFHIVLQFRTGFISPSSRVFGRGELIEDPKAIAKRYLMSYFIVDVLAVLPLPQVVILIVVRYLNSPLSLATKDLLKIVIISQYVPRLFRIYPLYKEVTRTSGIFTETPWAGAVFNLVLYLLFSHVLGAFWYLFSIESKHRCWRNACDNNGCELYNLYCGNASCLLESNETKSPADFDFGIFLDALQSHVVDRKDFSKKFFYCFWWGLRNLSSLGQNLKTSTYVWEIIFAISISIIGLVLFSLLIGNMQKYLQSITVRVEEMRVKRRDAEQWMSHRMLPDNLRKRIRRYDQYKWQETRGVEENSLIRNLPKDLRRDINRHLCWTLLTRVPMFEKMDQQLLDAMCDHLKPVLYTEKSFIVREGDPVDEMLFIMRGNILTMTTNGGRTGFFNSDYLKAGDFCGEELLTWALDPNSSSSLPISTRTVQAIKDVEAFSLMAGDLKSVASQFRRLHSKHIQHTFRLYSQQWRTWAACFIQAAWRRHCRRKIEKSLQEAEDRMHETLAEEGGSYPSLGATIYASKFAATMLGVLHNNHPHNAKLSPRLPSGKLPPLLLQKPAEPDFSAKDHS
ncbi:cyclic nucleotide-gated ion channel 1-like [Olea europaea var. sylvestris]|uniref:cyclic nucleotide-gated ion channel 1-like n=1 Tax=Olea europaea var. sylvestris TaxID=158386 RepID=UPI000C1D87CA|nr:cyclic nucleotide-gated ion channel 1-like [Olea europaea var. sylvestris]